MDTLASTPFTAEEIAQLFLRAIEQAAQDQARYNRGKQYALNNAVHRVTCQQGTVTATVVGSQGEHYAVTVHIQQPTDDWQQRAIALRQSAILYQQWQRQQLSYALLQWCHQANIPLLLPTSLQPTCSCPDNNLWCKHAIAVGFFIAHLIANEVITIYDLAQLPSLSVDENTVIETFWHCQLPRAPEPYPQQCLQQWYFVDSMLPIMINNNLSPVFMQTIQTMLQQLSNDN